MVIQSMVESIKSKVRSLKKKSKEPYVKLGKPATVKVEIRRRNPKILTGKTLDVAGNPGKKHLH